MQKIIELSSVEKTFGDQELFKIKHLEAIAGSRIGILGPNGSGKSTLMKIIAHTVEPDKGSVRTTKSCAYMQQPTGDYVEVEAHGTYAASLFDVLNNPGLSGGERTKRLLANALSQNPELLLLDEPTTNMDLQSIVNLESELHRYQGTLVVISHDKVFLNSVVDTLWILDAGTIRVFDGSVEAWENQKQREIDDQYFRYTQNQKERKRLEEEAARVRIEAQKVGKKPKNMSSKEARLYAGTASIQQGHVQRRARQLLSRKEHVTEVEKPDIQIPIHIKLGAAEALRAKIAVAIEAVTLKVGDRILLDHTSSYIESNQCTVLTGVNGAGKTTLIHAILNGHEGISVNPGIRFGVFSQFHESIQSDMTLIDNVMQTSIYDRGKVRTILNNLRFSKEDLEKQASKLSGGERAKCVLAMLIVSDINALILDEPSNHLDLDTQDAMLGMLSNWDHTLILITHDRRFIEVLGDTILEIKNKELLSVYHDKTV